MSKHSQEPWHVELGFEHHVLVDADGNDLFTSHYPFWKEIPRVLACVNACAGIPTEWLEKYGRTAFVRKIVLVPDDKVGVVHEMLSKPLELSEKVVALRTCDECGGLTTTTEADHE